MRILLLDVTAKKRTTNTINEKMFAVVIALQISTVGQANVSVY